MTVEIETLLQAATLAPSLHNSQPWAFAVGAEQIKVYADPSRQLHHADASGSALLISCGAAVFNLRVAAEHLGFHPRVRLLPDPSDPTLVATVQLGHRRPTPGALDIYYSSIPERHTNRRPFRNQAISLAVLATLSESVRHEGAMLRIYNDPVDISRIVDLLHDADVADHGDPGRTAERQAWIGGPHRADGIPTRSLGPRPTDPRTPFRDLGHAVAAKRDHVQFEKTPTVAVLSTTHDQPVDRVRAGQALQRLLLEATAAGIACSFLNQPLEQADLRERVRSPTTGVGHSHVILRLGHGSPVPGTPRRPVLELQRRAPAQRGLRWAGAEISAPKRGEL